ncbi:MAG: hypothetical protein AB8C13_08960 [Phycisphaerales bacterium]
MRTAHRSALLTLALLTAIPTLSGCLLHQSKSTRIEGAYVQPSELSRVKVHHTTEDEVLNILSEPTARKSNDDGSETWTWNWTEKQKGSGSLFLIFAGSSEKHIEETAHITFADGIAIDKWRD